MSNLMEMEEGFLHWIQSEIKVMVPGLKVKISYYYNLKTYSHELLLCSPSESSVILEQCVRSLTARELSFTKEDFSRLVLFPMVMQLTGGQ